MSSDEKTLRELKWVVRVTGTTPGRKPLKCSCLIKVADSPTARRVAARARREGVWEETKSGRRITRIARENVENVEVMRITSLAKQAKGGGE